MFSLLDTRWLPVRRASGGITRIRPCDISETNDPFVASAWGRADFDAATLEFLIGLLATACPPPDRPGWRDWWATPPSPDELAQRFAPYARAFVLDGDGPRFLQDQVEFDSEPVAVSQLLIEAPGGNTERLNKDLFEKRGRVPSLSRAAAAMALFTLQTYAPSGGVGHRTSMRGGGPLTTTVAPDEAAGVRPSLWGRLWLNVVAQDDSSAPCGPSVFPWLGPTRTSEDKRTTTPEDAQPAQAYWGMPRRIRLDFIANDSAHPCAITGEVDDIVVKTYRTKNYGTSYTAWEHPLTPYYKPKKDAVEWLPMHPQPGGIGYRHWVALVQGEAGLSRPAAAVSQAKDRLLDLWGPQAARRARLSATGFDTDNMKARGFVESEMPLHLLPAGPARSAFEDLCLRLVAGASETAGQLVRGVRNALFGDRTSVKTERELFATLRERFYAETEPAFFQLADTADARLAVAADRAAIVAELTQDWVQTMRRAALALFDEAVPMDTDAVKDAPRIVQARRNLVMALSGYGASGLKLFGALQIASPQSTAAQKSPKELA